MVTGDTEDSRTHVLLLEDSRTQWLLLEDSRTLGLLLEDSRIQGLLQKDSRTQGLILEKRGLQNVRIRTGEAGFQDPVIITGDTKDTTSHAEATTC